MHSTNFVAPYWNPYGGPTVGGARPVTATADGPIFSPVLRQGGSL